MGKMTGISDGMEITSPIVSVSPIVQTPILYELSELIAKISDRPIAIGTIILLSILGYFAFRK